MSLSASAGRPRAGPAGPVPGVTGRSTAGLACSAPETTVVFPGSGPSDLHYRKNGSVLPTNPQISQFFPQICQIWYMFQRTHWKSDPVWNPGFSTFSGGLVEVCGIRRVRPRLLQEIKSKHLYTYKVLCKLSNIDTYSYIMACCSSWAVVTPGGQGLMYCT